MIVTIDTNVLVNGFRDKITDHFFIILRIARDDDPTKVGHDHLDHIFGEYRRHLDRDRDFQKWYGRLQQLQKIHYCDHHIDNRHLLRLRALGCHEAADHVFIGVALHSDKVLISEDRGVGKGPRGNQSPHPEALKYLQEQMGINVYDPQEACATLWPVP